MKSSDNNHTLLVVNDMPDQLDLMSAILRQVGYRVLTAPRTAGARALRLP